VRAIEKDNSVEAAYFNPRPINVHEAHYQVKEGKINLFVELRDVAAGSSLVPSIAS